jgi:hypothetical protein
LLDMRERQDRLERQIYASRPGGGWRSNISQVIVYRSFTFARYLTTAGRARARQLTPSAPLPRRIGAFLLCEIKDSVAAHRLSEV